MKVNGGDLVGWVLEPSTDCCCLPGVLLAAYVLIT